MCPHLFSPFRILYVSALPMEKTPIMFYSVQSYPSAKTKEMPHLSGRGSPGGGALTHRPLSAASITGERRKIKIRIILEGKTFFTEEFHLLLLRKRKKIPPCPSNNTLSLSYSQ